ncbi:MAG: NAD-dependent epimerase/dehydratase family protein, partial [Pseudomonadota bacterium]
AFNVGTRPRRGVDVNAPELCRRGGGHRLEQHKQFTFHQRDITQLDTAAEALSDDPVAWADIDCFVHMAAQPGVRYSLENPYAYLDANVTGQLAVLELARHLPHHPAVVYASSSSVYGRNTKRPYSEDDRTDHPASLYAATKQAAERIAETYAHLYPLHLTGLRFFTVYGPWGRPDMAPYLFTKALFEDQTIKLFNYGKQRRDFTYIDDIVSGVVAAVDRAQQASVQESGHHRLFNLGNNRSETLEDFVAALETSTGRTARLERVPAQPGDVTETYADITRSQTELGFTPRTDMAEGLSEFVAWYRDYHQIS